MILGQLSHVLHCLKLFYSKFFQVEYDLEHSGQDDLKVGGVGQNRAKCDATVHGNVSSCNQREFPSNGQWPGPLIHVNKIVVIETEKH